MVDVGDKDVTQRVAVAEGALRMDAATLSAIVRGDTPKGDPLAVGRIAGIQAAKRTPDLLPLCHPLPLTAADVELWPDVAVPGVRARATVRTRARTGGEMVALSATTGARLCVYDMA
jgi:cyclic pyranopterin phosphate synthase